MISAVVATHGRLDVLKRSLPTLFKQDLPADEYEVVVVVDGPDQETCSWLRGLSSPTRLSIIQQQHQGLATARNAGLRKATGEIVLLLDNDLLCEPFLLRAHAEAHREVSLVAFGPVYVSPDSPRTIASEWVRRSAEVRAKRLLDSGPDWPRDIALCANYSAPRQLLLSAGGFDESFVGACEEFDLGIRLRKAGVKFRYVPEAIVKEFYVKTARDLVRVDGPVRGRNEVRLCRKHPEYRSVSILAGFNRGALTTRLLRQVAIRTPFPVESILAPAFRAAEAVSGLWVGERIATRLLEFRRGAALFRSAKREAGSLASFCSEFSMQLPVLLYHRVRPHRAGSLDPTVSCAEFARQMDWLARRAYETITPSQWLAWRNEGVPLPCRAVMLTFDDSSAALAEHVFPILKERSFSAAAFIVTGQLGKSGGSEVARRSSSDDAMSEEQILSWSANGIEFGSCSRGHTDLTALSESAVRQEIEVSADDLERLTGKRPISFAYPSGLLNPIVRQIVSTAYPLAFTTNQGLNHLGSDPSMLNRVTVRSTDSMFDFRCYVLFGTTPSAFARRRRQSATRSLAGRRT